MMFFFICYHTHKKLVLVWTAIMRTLIPIHIHIVTTKSRTFTTTLLDFGFWEVKLVLIFYGLLGLLFFFVAEKFIRNLSGVEDGHGHSHDAPKKHVKKVNKSKKAKQSDNEDSAHETDDERHALLEKERDEAEARNSKAV